MKVKRVKSVIRSFLKKNIQTTISMKRYRRELSVNVVIHRFTLSLKITNLRLFPVLPSNPKQVLDCPKQELFFTVLDAKK